MNRNRHEAHHKPAQPRQRAQRMKREDLPVVIVERVRCPACASTKLETQRTRCELSAWKSQARREGRELTPAEIEMADATVERMTICQDCGTRFIVQIEHDENT